MRTTTSFTTSLNAIQIYRNMEKKTDITRVNEGLEDEATLDKIRYFKGSFQDLKDIMDKKAKQNTNAMDEVDYEYPNPRKATGTSPVYQTFGVVNNPNKLHEMKNIKPFEQFNEEEYYVMGFGAPSYSGGSGGASPAGYGLGWPDYRSYTGYTMTPVTGVVSTLKETIVKEAEAYDKNDNPEHTAASYLKEASKCVAEGLKQCYDSFNVTEESLDLDESQIYEEYDVAGKTQVIKDRNVRNQKSMQMAKLKGDKTGEKMYQLKLQIDQIDLQKAKLKGEVSKIQDERKAQRDKIKSLGE
jgi:hypothetical protein